MTRKIIFSTQRKKVSRGVDSITTKTIDCAIRHIGTFIKQSSEGVVAQFGEPCAECEYALKECDFNWLEQLSPLLKRSNVAIVLAKPVHLRKSDIEK